MKPILYSATETNFTSNGFGRLSDAISCNVHEVLNGVYELTMVYPVEGIHFSDLQEHRIIYAIHDETGEPQPFEIYRISRPLNRRVTINATHISYRLNKAVVNPFIANGVQTAMMDLVSEAVVPHGFTFVTDKTTVANMNVTAPVAIRTIMGGVQGSVIDVYGGEWEFNHFTCTLRNRRGQDSGVNIRYGKNLTDITKTTDATNLWTGIVPYWTGTDDSNEQTSVVYNGVIYSDYRNLYPYDMIIAVDATSAFEAEPTQTQLGAWGRTYVRNNAKQQIPLSVDISFVQLWQTEEYKDVAPLQRLHIGDTVSVFYEALGVDDVARITEYNYNVLLERYDSMTIGDVRTNLAVAVSQDIKDATKDLPSKTFIEIALDKATDLITGGLGGHVVINTNEAGQPNEILVMNTDNKETATRVMRINYQGIAFGTGYNGPFNSAWTTLDGTFDAQFINVIHLTAAAITTGILKDQANKNFWNMDTGEFQLAAATTVGGSTVQSIANSAASTAVANQTQQSIFNKLTNNGQVQGIYLKNGKLYINATYIDTGSLDADLITSGKIQSNNGQVYFDLDNNEIACSKLRPVQRSGQSWYSFMNNCVLEWLSTLLSNNGTGVASTTHLMACNVKYDDGNDECGLQIAVSDSENELLSLSPLDNATFRIGSTYKAISSSSGTEYNVGIMEFEKNSGISMKYKSSRTWQTREFLVGENEISFKFHNSSNKIKTFVLDDSDFSLKGDVSITGGIDVSGTKNRRVNTPSYGEVLMDAYETTSPMFGDVGEAKTDDSGICVVAIDDIFREVSRTDIEYQVFLQKEGQGDLWIDEKHPAWFTVRGTANLKFAWEIKAKQRDYELNRTERKALKNVNDDYAFEDYESFYEEEINYVKEQEDIFYDQTA